jgi:hypothetical protein
MTYMGTTTQQAGFIPYKANVAFSGTNTITIDIGNSGTSSGQIVKVYVGESAANTTDKTPSSGFPLSIDAGKIESFTVSYPWASGETYYFRVVPNSGAAVEFQAKAP